MRKFIVVAILIVVGIHYGYSYLTSDDFQKYGDRTKAPWTCRINNLMAQTNLFLNEHEKAYDLFQRVVARCPDTPMAEEAEFQSADCLEKMGRYPDAIAAFKLYAEKYKVGKRAMIANRAATVLQSGM